MKFEKPEVVKDYSKAILESSVALAKISCGAPVSAGEHLPRIWSKVKGELEDKPENRAWRFLATCVSTALIMLLREPRMRCDLTEQELTDHAKGLIDALPDTGCIRASDLTNMALARYTRDCIQQAPELIAQATPDAGFKKDQLKQMYSETLARSVTAVFEGQLDLFNGMVEAITGPTSIPEMRETAWQRHGAWCRGLFCETRIFSPDSDIDIPLSHVYQELRCYWNEEYEKEREGERGPLKYRTATVSDLHETINTWLGSFDKSDAIRLIAGGPGSGKSSFARAFAAELFVRQSHRILFVQLQGFQTAGTTLREVIGRHLKSRHGLRLPNKCEGFPENPLDWHGEDTRPLLLIFDGLDELTTNKDREQDLTRKFVSNLKHLLNELNGEERSAAAIVLGRDLAMTAALEDGGLGLDNLVHVAPIRKMTRGDLQLGKNSSLNEIDEGFDPVIDPRELMEVDTRRAYWDQWCRVQGTPQSEPPPAIHDKRMSELNVEPLLLHLLIISDFRGDRWKEAADNRNLVYHDIFRKVLKRNKNKGLDAYKKLEEKHFFELMEVFGLAAFRGNGRTGDHTEFERLRECYPASKADKRIYSGLDGADLKNIALMIHSRQEIEGAGFEFMHKSFGEYLAARALLGAADRLQRSWHHDDSNEDELQLALRWVDFVGTGELSDPVLRFMRDECRLWKPVQVEKTIDALTAIFDKTLEHGFPVQKSDEFSSPTYRHLEHRQKCAEQAMLATITSLWMAQNDDDESSETPLIKLRQFESSRSAASYMINRLFPPIEVQIGIDPTLTGMSLKGSQLHSLCIQLADLSGADLSEANLSGAILSQANLNRANLSEADLSWADLKLAHLRGADLTRARLSHADLDSADLSEANLSNAGLFKANLQHANLQGTNLHNANLRCANLRRANLNGANLESTDLTDCHTEAMSVRSVDFTKDVKLTQEQVNTFFGVKSGVGQTLLPDHLSYPGHWYNAESLEDAVSQIEYMNAWRIWRESH